MNIEEMKTILETAGNIEALLLHKGKIDTVEYDRLFEIHIVSEQLINKLEQDNKELREENERLKCCGNCEPSNAYICRSCIRSNYNYEEFMTDNWQPREVI